LITARLILRHSSDVVYFSSQ